MYIYKNKTIIVYVLLDRLIKIGVPNRDATVSWIGRLTYKSEDVLLSVRWRHLMSVKAAKWILKLRKIGIPTVDLPSKSLLLQWKGQKCTLHEDYKDLRGARLPEMVVN